MPPYKKQHYVPQSYLKFFSRDGKNLFLYNPKSNMYIRSSIKDLCYGDYFNGRDIELEKNLSIGEKKQSEIIKKLVDQKSLDCLNDEEWLLLLLFIMLQSTRTKQHREMIIECLEDIYNLYIIPDMNLDFEVKVNYPLAHLNGMLTAFTDFILISDLYPVLVLNDTDKSFICSDSPVVLYNNINIKEMRLRGYHSPGLQIFFPLNEKTLLLLIDPVFYNIKVVNYNTTILTNASDVDAINKLQFYYFEDNFFFSEASQFEDLKKLYDEVVGLKNLKRIKSFTSDKWIDNDSMLCYESIKLQRAKFDYDLELSFLKSKDKEIMRFQEMVRRAFEVNKNASFCRNKEICEFVKSRRNDALREADIRKGSNNTSI